jgi:hypothetical protein
MPPPNACGTQRPTVPRSHAMNPAPPPLPSDLALWLEAEPELFSDARLQDEVLSGTLGHEHPMAWRSLSGLEAVEALTLVAPSPTELDAMPDWRDPGWSVSMPHVVHGEAITLWWHAATQQAMLASRIAFGELAHAAVARTLRLHHEALSLCRQLAQEAWAAARPPQAIALTIAGNTPMLPFA